MDNKINVKRNDSNKEIFLKQTFCLSDYEFISIKKLYPHIVNMDKETVEKRVEFYKATFNLTQEEFNTMFKTLPSLLGLSEQSIKSKYECILDIGIPIQSIIENPRILAAPLKTLKLKYMLFSIIDNDKKFLSINWTVSSLDKSWARYRYLSEHFIKIKPSWIILSERNFQKKYKITSDELILKYPLDENAENFISSHYNAHVKTNGSKPLALNN